MTLAVTPRAALARPATPAAPLETAGAGGSDALDELRASRVALDALVQQRSEAAETIRHADEMVEAGLDRIRDAVKALAKERWPSLERFYRDVMAQSGRERAATITSTYTVRNALVPGGGAADTVHLAARVATNGPVPEGIEAA